MTSRCRLALVLLLALAGCGVPMQSTPVPIEPGRIPTVLSSPDHPSTPGTAIPGRPAVQVNFVRDDRLVKVLRDAPTTTLTDRLNTVIEALQTGPSTGEQANGITSALEAELRLTVVEIQRNRVVVELSGDSEGRSATENVLAVGQIVLSITALPSIDQVSFSRDGTPVEALQADGALTTEPLTARDYATLRSG
ncbi:GerMN domain-containing protein [Kribbella sp. NBC_00889]|uniref:GerMN domain-containing protein n=1 Tax=Kribbella sp. NBC_00889 TaxID=2975974 RepID=UPI00386E2D62|nr:GerMN domain-containing protein [Kribbella sp. NBC_00889]